MNYRYYGLIILVSLFLTSCGGSNDYPVARGALIGAPTEKSTHSIDQLDSVTAASGLRVLTGHAKCDVRVVQINYQTPGAQPGEMTNASAAVFIPSGTNPDCQEPLPPVMTWTGSATA